MLISEAELLKYLDDRIAKVPEGDEEAANMAVWYYPHETMALLSWIGIVKPGQTLLQALQSRNKEDDMKEKMLSTRRKIEDLELKRNNAATLKKREEFERAIGRQENNLKRLKESTERMRANTEEKLAE